MTGVPIAVCKEMAQGRNDRIKELKKNRLDAVTADDRKRVKESRKNNYILHMAVT